MKTFFSRLFLFLASLFLLFSCNAFSEISEDSEENMQNMHAAGLFMLSKGKVSSAEEKFAAAGQKAVLLGSWQGCMESGYGFLACDKPYEGVKYFENAFAIAREDADWRGCLAAGVALLNMPLEFKVRAKGNDAVNSAYEYVLSEQNLYGLIEIAKASWAMKKIDMSLKCLDVAKLIAEKQETAVAMNQIASVYKSMGRKNEAKECYILSKKFAKGVKQIVLPPPGWEPAGETVAGPKDVPIETQKTLRSSSDSQIDRNAAEGKEAKRLKLEQDKIEAEKYQYAVAYAPYYSYPFPFYDTWRPFGSRYINSWATDRLGFYYGSRGNYYRFDYRH
ncbi:MAG: hypothetical protein PHO00_03300 [bacterium]|nr:hypothetical protein [bacterium]